MRDYDDPRYKQFRQAVRKRDKGCRWPGCKCKKKIQVHHIMKWYDYPTLRYVVTNGICLCKKHHNLTRGKEMIYAPMFMRIINAL